MRALSLPCRSPTTALESVAVSDASVSDAANKYIGLLLGMTSSFAGSGGGATVGAAAGSAADGASAGATSPDEALAAAEAGAGASSSPLSAPASKLRHAAQWQWSEALFSPAPGAQPPVTAQSDAVFELASTLVAYAVRLMHAAAKACEDTASGVAGPAATRAYKASVGLSDLQCSRDRAALEGQGSVLSAAHQCTPAKLSYSWHAHPLCSCCGRHPACWSSCCGTRCPPSPQASLPTATGRCGWGQAVDQRGCGRASGIAVSRTCKCLGMARGH